VLCKIFGGSKRKYRYGCFGNSEVVGGRRKGENSRTSRGRERIMEAN
jgi:hypothetical protein